MKKQGATFFSTVPVLAFVHTASLAAAQGRFPLRVAQWNVKAVETLAVGQSQVSGSASVTNFGMIDFPGSSDSAATFVNDHGQFAGGYGPGLESGISNWGFVLMGDAFKVINFPGATMTLVSAITNSGEVAGTHLDSAGNEARLSARKKVPAPASMLRRTRPGAVPGQVSPPATPPAVRPLVPPAPPAASVSGPVPPHR